MSKERLDPEKMANELAGASAFFRRPTQAEPSTPPQQPASPAPTPEPSPQPDVMTSRRHSVTPTSDSPAAPEGFNINRPTTSRDSLRLSTDETKALESLRQTLKWDYDLTISKNDICRAALHALLEDFRAKGDKSSAVTRLKRKQTSR